MTVLEIIQYLTSRMQVKRAPRLLFAIRRLFKRPNCIYNVYNNTLLKIDPSVNFHWLNVVNYGGYEAVLLFEKYLKPGDVYLDIGANYGYMSINAARIVGPKGRVIAVEPEPRAAELLEFNAALNDAALEIVRKAISDTLGEANFNVATEMGLSRLDNLHQNTFGMMLQDNIVVERTTLDLLISQIIPDREVTLVKMDVEGHEMRILQGASQLISRKNTMFMLEINPGALSQNGLSFKDIFEFFATRGYEVNWIHSHAADWFRWGRQPTLEKVKDPSKFMNSSKFLHNYADILAIPLDRR